MKIKNNYVSNSTSSSFIIKKIDENKIKNILSDFVNKIDLNDEYNKYYKVSLREIQFCLFEKFKESKQMQDDYLNIYLNNELHEIFYNIFQHYIYLRQWELSPCKEECKDYEKEFIKNNKGKCHHCNYHYMWNHAKNSKIDYENAINNFPEFDFSKDIEKIKDIVYLTETEKTEHGVQVKTNWNYWYDLIEKKIDDYKKIWIEKYPNAYVLSFSSDCGNDADCLLRMNVNELKTFLNSYGFEGFCGENS